MPKAKPKKPRRKVASKNDAPAVPPKAGPLRLEYRSPAELAENPSNWRRHPEHQIAALNDVIQQVGWAGACLLNERTGRLIDGHARRKVAIEQGVESVPVLIGDWDEETERVILATLDPIAGQAEADAAKLDALIAGIQTNSAAVRKLLDDLKAAHSVIPEPPPIGAGGDEFDATPIDAPGLPSGDKSPYQQMTFTLHDDQTEVVKSAIEAAKKQGPFVDTQNENSNGNALARIAEAFIGQG